MVWQWHPGRGGEGCPGIGAPCARNAPIPSRWPPPLRPPFDYLRWHGNAASPLAAAPRAGRAASGRSRRMAPALSAPLRRLLPLTERSPPAPPSPGRCGSFKGAPAPLSALPEGPPRRHFVPSAAAAGGAEGRGFVRARPRPSLFPPLRPRPRLAVCRRIPSARVLRGFGNYGPIHRINKKIFRDFVCVYLKPVSLYKQ